MSTPSHAGPGPGGFVDFHWSWVDEAREKQRRGVRLPTTSWKGRDFPQETVGDHEKTPDNQGKTTGKMDNSGNTMGKMEKTTMENVLETKLWKKSWR